MTFSAWLQLAASYITFLRRSQTKYGVHSPFVYDLITKVIKDHQHYPEYTLAEEIRDQCLHSRQVIEISNYGASKPINPSGNERKQVCAIARAAITQRCGRLLNRLVRYFGPENLLEMGTSLGISSIYMASAAPTAKYTTMEGCSTTAELACSHLKQAGLPQVQMLIGDFSYLLPRYIAAQQHIDFAFFDGNHTYTATLDYFYQCLPLIKEDSVFVFHDIHWSRGMEKAWAHICKHSQVTVSIDLFEVGLIFFRKGLSKQDFIIRF